MPGRAGATNPGLAPVAAECEQKNAPFASTSADVREQLQLGAPARPGAGGPRPDGRAPGASQGRERPSRAAETRPADSPGCYALLFSRHSGACAMRGAVA